MQEISVQPSEAWDYFQEHKKELRENSHIIAKNDEYGVEITITEKQGFPLFSVTADGYQYEEIKAINEEDCLDTVDALYEDYLTGTALILDEENLSQEDMIAERETELDDAIISLLDAVLDGDSQMEIYEKDIDLEELCTDLKDYILEHLAKDYGLTSIRRPMILEDDETGEDFFTENPYECMVYDD